MFFEHHQRLLDCMVRSQSQPRKRYRIRGSDTEVLKVPTIEIKKVYVHEKPLWQKVLAAIHIRN